MEDSDHSNRLCSDLDASEGGSSGPGEGLLKSILPGNLQSWIPKEILSLPCMPSPANRELLLRKYGIAALHWATLTRSPAVAGYLLNKGADVHVTTLRVARRPSSARDSKEIQGVTPLFLAARSGHFASVEVLLEHGAVEDILKASSKGDTALHAAALSGDVTVMRLLIKSLAAGLCRGCLVDERGYNKRTPLHYAAGGGHPEIVRALLEAGADINARDEYGATPFHFAAGWGNSAPCMDLLLGALKMRNVDEVTDGKAWTALHYAAALGQLTIVQWLLDKKADFDAVEHLHGNGPLHLAARSPGIIYALISAKADFWLENKDGEVAIGLAHSHKDAMSVKAHIHAIQNMLPREAVDPFEKHGKDGSTLLHYVSAYGAAEDMAWIVGLSIFLDNIMTTTASDGIKVTVVNDASRTAVDWAV